MLLSGDDARGDRPAKSLGEQLFASREDALQFAESSTAASVAPEPIAQAALAAFGQSRDDARNSSAPATSTLAAIINDSVKAASTLPPRRSSSATIGGPAVWPMLHSAVTSPVVLAT